MPKKATATRPLCKTGGKGSSESGLLTCGSDDRSLMVCQVNFRTDGENAWSEHGRLFERVRTLKAGGDLCKRLSTPERVDRESADQGHLAQREILSRTRATGTFHAGSAVRGTVWLARVFSSIFDMMLCQSYGKPKPGLQLAVGAGISCICGCT